MSRNRLNFKLVSLISYFESVIGIHDGMDESVDSHVPAMSSVVISVCIKAIQKNCCMMKPGKVHKNNET